MGFLEKKRVSGNDVKLREDDGAPEYADMEGMADAVFDLIIQLDPSFAVRIWHRCHRNHAAAITDLAQYGYPELAPKAIKAHRQHLRLWLALPNLIKELGPGKESKHAAHSPEYWTGKIRYDSALLTHRVKTMFGFDELAAVTENEDKVRDAYAKLRHLI